MHRTQKVSANGRTKTRAKIREKNAHATRTVHTKRQAGAKNGFLVEIEKKKRLG